MSERIPESTVTLVLEIVREAAAMRDRVVLNASSSVSYCCIFAHEDDEFHELVNSLAGVGVLASQTATGPVFVIPPIETVAGPLRVLKVRKPDVTRPERGDADFAARDYSLLKRTNLGRHGISLITRPEFEMIEAVAPEFNVRVYFSNPPVEKHAGIAEALASATEN